MEFREVYNAFGAPKSQERKGKARIDMLK